jgi:hypothetical protein
VGLAHASGDHLRLPASDIETRQQKDEEEVVTLYLVLKHPDTTIAIYV